nr:hypothetical protein [Tanacetum cinerariifolium]
MDGYVMPKCGNKNLFKDHSWIDIIKDDVYDTFYRDEEEEAKVAKASEDMKLSIMKYDKGNGKLVEDNKKGKVHDIQNRVGSVKVDLAKEIKAKQVNDQDLDTFDLENRIKKLEEDFGRLLKTKKANESKKAREAKKARDAKLANQAKKARELN